MKDAGQVVVEMELVSPVGENVQAEPGSPGPLSVASTSAAWSFPETVSQGLRGVPQAISSGASLLTGEVQLDYLSACGGTVLLICLPGLHFDGPVSL